MGECQLLFEAELRFVSSSSGVTNKTPKVTGQSEPFTPPSCQIYFLHHGYQVASVLLESVMIPCKRSVQKTTRQSKPILSLRLVNLFPTLQPPK